MLLRIIIFISIIANSSSLYANPAPLNLEMNKANLQDVKKSYKILSQGNYPLVGKEYFLDITNIDIQQLKQAYVLCDDNDIVKAVQLTIGKNRFHEIYESLAKKYKLVGKNIPHVGDKLAEFVDEDTRIVLEAPHMSFDMHLNYFTVDIAKKISEAEENKNNEKRAKEEKAL